MTFLEEYKETIQLLHHWFPENPHERKPRIPHLLRVGEFLFEHAYSTDIVNAGLLHDVLEWTDAPQTLIQEKFGEHVLLIVEANTKDTSIEDLIERRENYVRRCADLGIDALIVKAADVLDSYQFYSKTNNLPELERCKHIASLILTKTNSTADPIFKKLKETLH